MTSQELIGIGVAVLDNIMVVPDWPQQQSVTQATGRCSCVGGGVAVAMATAASLGVTSGLADRLGTDHTSGSIIETLRGAGVETQCIEIDSTATASLASIWVTLGTGERTIVFSPGQNIQLGWSAALADRVALAKVLHINGRHELAAMSAIEVAKASGTKVSYDGGAYRYRAEVLPMVGQADLLIVSQQFAAAHIAASRPKIPDAMDAAQLAVVLGDDFDAELVGVTCGEHGSWFANSNGDAWHQSAYPVQNVVDTTGCGDTFHGAFLAAFARGHSPRRCADIASRVAADQATRMGAFSSEVGDLASLLT